MFVLIGLSVGYVKGVDILRMDERIYESEEVEMIETEMDEVDTVDFEKDEDAACKSCCDPPVVDTCAELMKKLDEIDIAIAGIGCPEAENIKHDEHCMVVAEEAIPECMERMAGTEYVGDGTKMKICLQEITGDHVHFDEVESGSTLQGCMCQGCMCQGFLANRKTLEDASKLLCSNNRNAKSSHPITHNPPIAIADDVPVSSSLYDDVLLWGLLYQGYYQGSWQSRRFSFHHSKVPLKPRKKVGMFTKGGHWN